MQQTHLAVKKLKLQKPHKHDHILFYFIIFHLFINPMTWLSTLLPNQTHMTAPTQNNGQTTQNALHHRKKLVTKPEQSYS